MLISINEAAAVLGLKSRGSIYRKLRNGELKSVTGPDGGQMVERDGLEDRWAAITRTRSDSPNPQRQTSALRPVSERTAKRPPKVVDQAPESVITVDAGDDELPEYAVSRARSEFERANLLELERKQKEGLLLPVDQVEKVWANSITIAKTKLLALPSRLRQRIPHLTLEEIAIAEGLIRECLEELASGDGGDAD